MTRFALFVSLSFVATLGCDRTSADTVPPDTAGTTETPASGEAAVVAAVPEGYATVTPIVVVEDVAAATQWYAKAFGAETTMKLEAPDGTLMHAEIQIGDARVMVVPEDPHANSLSPKNLGGSNGAFYLYTQDTDATFARAVEAGAEVGMPPTDMMWGDRMAGITDPAGHHWELATHVEDVTPEQMAERGQALGEAMEAGKPMPEIKLEKTAKAWKPQGYTAVTPTLVIEGGAEGMAFYETALGATITETMLMPDGKGLMHGEVKIGTSMVMLHSVIKEEGENHNTVTALGGHSVRLYLYVEGADAMWKTAVASGGADVAKPEDVFWGDRLGVIGDPAGTHWGIASRVKNVPPEEIAKLLAEMPARGGDGEAAAGGE